MPEKEQVRHIFVYYSSVPQSQNSFIVTLPLIHFLLKWFPLAVKQQKYFQYAEIVIRQSLIQMFQEYRD